MFGTILAFLLIWFLVSVPVSLITARFLSASSRELEFAQLEHQGKIGLLPTSTEPHPEQPAAAKQLA